jgi:ribosomal protein S14
MKAYLDTATGCILSVEDWKELGLDTFAKDMGLEPIYKSHGQTGIACECELCGRPLGSLNPDKAAWIRLGLCRDCDCC